MPRLTMSRRYSSKSSGLLRHTHRQVQEHPPVVAEDPPRRSGIFDGRVCHLPGGGGVLALQTVRALTEDHTRVIIESHTSPTGERGVGLP